MASTVQWSLGRKLKNPPGSRASRISPGWTVGESNSIEVVDDLQFSNDIGLLPEDLLIEENLNTHDNTLDDI